MVLTHNQDFSSSTTFMQRSIMSDILEVVTSESQYLIKFQPNIRCSKMNRAPKEVAHADWLD